MTRRCGSVVKVLMVAGGLAALGSGALRADDDFVRGDVNGDGEVTLADAHALGSWLFLGRDGFECRDAMDLNDDGQANLTDVVRIFLFSVGANAEGIPSPWPDPGPDPTEDDPRWPMGCASYGGGSPLEDPAARVTVLDATSGGGTARLATIQVAVSSNEPIGAYSAKVSFDPALVESTGEAQLSHETVDAIAAWPPLPEGALPGVLRLGYVPIVLNSGDCVPPCGLIGPGEDIVVLSVDVCLAPGTAAGEYRLVMEEAELIDAASSRSIRPVLESGTLTVIADVEDSPCSPIPPPPPDVTFRLEDAYSAPGATATVPFLIQSTLPSQGFSFSVDFDEDVLEATRIERLFSRPSGTPYEFQRFELNNDNAFPGNDGVLEGFLVGAAVISLTDTTDVLPPDDEVEVLEFHFRVSPDTRETETEVRFVDGALGGDGAAVTNGLIASGRSITPSDGGAFVFLDAILRIVPDGIPFVRGDANGDLRVDVSDAVTILTYLFVGGGPPIRCLDAADSNDSGGLNLTDAVYSLEFLFRGGPSIPPPYPEPGMDPTDDGMECLGGGA